MIYFYARVSTKDQSLDRQMMAAREYKADIDKVFCDKQSGKDFDRPQYLELKNTVVSGDEVIVKELDRLGRDKDGMKLEIKWFKDHGVTLRILDIPTTLMDMPGQDWVADMVNSIMIEVLGAIAQQERKKILKRQSEGIDAMPIVNGKRISTKTGRASGRPSLDIDASFNDMRILQSRGEITVTECCKQLGISRSTWYARVRESA